MELAAGWGDKPTGLPRAVAARSSWRPSVVDEHATRRPEVMVFRQTRLERARHG